ncbi:ATP-grasp domain-containing protein [Lacticaseibacillus sharpeae]|nr:ATP-grasp domain-containing protein [Lacticaseibacillus sharpeae]
MMAGFVEPGATIGIIGGGVGAYQLARAAKNIGMRVAVLTTRADDVALQGADIRIVGTDRAAYERLAVCSVVTFSDEKIVDADLLANIFTDQQLPSGTDVLSMTQDRYLEKVFMEDLNLNVLPYGQVITAEDIDKVVATVGFPSVLKPIQKGIGADQQLLLASDVDVWRARGLLQKRPYILEAWLDNPRELAVTCVKTEAGLQVFPVVENQHERHELTATVAPAQVDGDVVMEILRIAEKISARLNYTGVFAIEFFYTDAGGLYIKRLSPGPRPGGDVLRGMTNTTQYNLHLRAILGWPIPNVKVNGEAVLLPIRQQQQGAINTQIQIKPDWRWQFFPAGSNPVGEVIVPGPLKTTIPAIAATDAFNMQSK